ncbi:predicted protein [Uncinocarpus reesii 1704]|uniref:Uncharacterized protein n=1 Tax=Uncinocarpus reesii (strain UAMH 1704) TaxID=336963 RepID=C4JQR8_UNCRE|nr:uncharacterized protein UREG_04735 [Uncinocarpus reesii 1704]EEP79889.1 predicted protein [Uncinocarpus reesii 1704]
MALGGPLVLSDIYLAVADEQLELARSALASHGLMSGPRHTSGSLTVQPRKVRQDGLAIGFYLTKPDLTMVLTAIIDALAERHGDEELNGQITCYFKIQYSYLLSVLHDDVLSCLPVEDQFFIDLFDKVIFYSARKKVCYFRQQIRAGLTTVETARTLVPRKDLEIAAIKAKYHKPGQTTNRGKPSVRIFFNTTNIMPHR